MTENILEFYKKTNNSLLEQLKIKQNIIDTYAQLNKINEEHITELKKHIEELENKSK